MLRIRLEQLHYIINYLNKAVDDTRRQEVKNLGEE